MPGAGFARTGASGLGLGVTGERPRRRFSVLEGAFSHPGLTRSERCANILTVLESPTTDRRSARREATKAEILDAAWALVREHGLAALSLRDLAARVGMRAPSLYQYFDSKHAIYDAMFAQGMRAAREAVGTIGENADTRTVFVEGARRMVEFATSDPARAQLLFQ